MEFWENRAKRNIPVENIGNLEDDPKLSKLKVKLEKKKVLEYLKLTPNMYVLDLGAGTCFWSIIFSKKVKKVYAVDYSKGMLELAMENVAKKGIKNIKFVHCFAQDFVSDIKFNLVFISGLFLYLNDDEAKKAVSNISKYSKIGTELLLRDGTGVSNRYEFTNRYSTNLKAFYSATYRTRQQFINLFRNIGFSLVKDENMLWPDSELNKYSETRLRIYLFKKVK